MGELTNIKDLASIIYDAFLYPSEKFNKAVIEILEETIKSTTDYESLKEVIDNDDYSIIDDFFDTDITFKETLEDEIRYFLEDSLKVIDSYSLPNNLKEFIKYLINIAVEDRSVLSDFVDLVKSDYINIIDNYYTD